MVQELTDANFKEEIANAVPIIVDFWAAWCGPCQRMKPVFEKLSSEYSGKLRFAKIDIEAHEESPSSVGVMNLPTFVVFKDGKEVDRIIGAMPEDEFKKKVDGILSMI